MKNWGYINKLAGIVCLSLLLAFLTGCGEKDNEKIAVGSKDFTESFIVAELYSLALEEAGFQVERKYNLGGTNVVHQAMTKGEVDIYPEYTGTCLINVLKSEPVERSEEIYPTIKEQYEERFGLTLLDASEANNSQGLAISRAVSEEYGIRTISELKDMAGNVRFASQGAFEENADGMPALLKAYGEFSFKEVNYYDNAIKYQLIKEGQTDLIVAFTSDGQLTDPDVVLLEDDRHAWTEYKIVPVVRMDLLAGSTRIAEAVNRISAALDTETMQRLNAEVDIEKREPEDVARAFYEQLSLPVGASGRKEGSHG